MRKQIFCFALCAVLIALGFPVEAQQTGKVYRIGVLMSVSPAVTAPLIDAFRQGLGELGYVEGKNYILEIRGSEGKLDRLSHLRIRELAAELVRLKVDVIVTTRLRLGLTSATRRIPIVMPGYPFDPVEDGIAMSLAWPRGNITGLTTMSTDLAGKRLELVHEAFPQVSRVAVLLDPGHRGSASHLIESRVAARALRLQLESLQVRHPEDFENAFQAARQRRIEALIIVTTLLMHNYRARIVNLEVKTRLPAMYTDQRFVLAGGLMSYGTNYDDLFRRAATYVDKILKGAKPGDLPIEQPRKFDLVINLKTAKQLGISIPPNILYQATKVIK